MTTTAACSDIPSLWKQFEEASPNKRLKAFAREVNIPYSTLRHMFVSRNLYRPRHRDNLTAEQYNGRRRADMRSYAKNFRNKNPNSIRNHIRTYWIKRLKAESNEASNQNK
jgi:hypothetical protein